MAIAEQEILQAIHDLIHDALTMSLLGGPPRASAESSYLTLALPGIGLDEAQLADAWSPVNPAGSMPAAESFAMLTDSVPHLAPYYSDSGVSLDQLYGQIVSADVAPSADLPPRRGSGEAHPADLHRLAISRAPGPVQRAFGVLYAEGDAVDSSGQATRVMVETPRHLRYLEKRAAYDAAVTRFMATYLQQKPPPGRAPLSSPEVNAALQDLRSSGLDDVEAALSTMSGAWGSSVAEIFSAARLTYELTKLGSLSQPGLFWHASRAIPASWLEPSAVSAQLDIRSDELRLDPWSPLARSGASTEQEGLWRRRGGPDAAWERSSLSGGTEGLHLSCRFARVEVRRPWLDASLFSLGRWSLQGRPRHSLSTGTLEDNPGIFSLLPTSMIVARDVQISARWAPRDVDEVNEALASGDSFGFGPFVVGGSSTRRGAAHRVEASFDGLTISVPGLQLIGWLNSLVPACPPLDG